MVAVRGLIFFFSCFSSEDVFDVLVKRPVNDEGGIISSFSGIPRLTSCVVVDSLVTAFSACCSTKRVTCIVKVDDFIRGRTRTCVNS